MTDPNFLVIGAQKCGTSWLARMLKQHPEVLTPDLKEVHFFNKTYNYEKGIDWYREKFQEYNGQKAVGEFTPNYFWTSSDEREIAESQRTSDIPKLVHSHYPDLKLIVCLRNPLDRAVSAYYQHIKDRRVSPSQRLSEVQDRFGITTMGFYDVHLQEWLKYYPFDRFLVLLYEEDIVENKQETLRKTYEFLGINEEFRPDDIETRYNPRLNHLYMRINYVNPYLARALKAILPAGFWQKEMANIPVYENEKIELASIYRNHNNQLAELIGRKPSWS